MSWKYAIYIHPLTSTLHSVWVHDPHHHHRQLYRPGSGAAPSWRGQNTHVKAIGETHTHFLFVWFAVKAHTCVYVYATLPSLLSWSLTTSLTVALHSCFALTGEDRALLHRDVLYWGRDKDHGPGLRVPQRLLPQEWMERHGLHCGPQRVSAKVFVCVHVCVIYKPGWALSIEMLCCFTESWSCSLLSLVQIEAESKLQPESFTAPRCW